MTGFKLNLVPLSQISTNLYWLISTIQLDPKHKWKQYLIEGGFFHFILCKDILYNHINCKKKNKSLMFSEQASCRLLTLPRRFKKILLFGFSPFRVPSTSSLEKGQPVTNGFRFPPCYQRLRLSLQCIVGKCLLPSVRRKASIKPTFLMTHCCLFFNSSFLIKYKLWVLCPCGNVKEVTGWWI